MIAATADFRQKDTIFYDVVTFIKVNYFDVDFIMILPFFVKE
jgi:hypothetical protein